MMMIMMMMCRLACCSTRWNTLDYHNRGKEAVVAVQAAATAALDNVLLFDCVMSAPC